VTPGVATPGVAPPIRVPARGAFTLIELVVVLFVMGLVVGLVVPAAVDAADASRPEHALRPLVTHLAAARLEAIESGTSRDAVLAFTDDAADGPAPHWPTGSLVPITPSGDALDGVTVRFDADGRASIPTIRFRDPRSGPASAAGAYAPGVPYDWAIRFDPVDGRPRVKPAAHAAREAL